MNEQIVKLVEQLAQKIGTTSEYLWSVLIKQASIQATIELCYFILILIGGFVLYKLHKYLLKETDDTESKYCEYEGLNAVMTIIAIIWVITFLVSFFSLGTVFTGFFNPEYWALNEILDALKSSK